MDLKQLRYFVAVVEQASFSRAAAHIRIAQTALSRKIAQLETEIGLPLLVRHSRGAAPTEAGIRLLERARVILRTTDEAKHDVVAMQSQASGPVVLALHPSPSLAHHLAPQLLAACLAELPKVRLSILDAHGPERVIAGQADLAILNDPLDSTRLTVKPILYEKVCLIGRPEPLLLEIEPIDLSGLLSIPMLLPGFGKGGFRHLLESAVTEAGASLKMVAEVDSNLARREMVKLGLGYTVNLAGSLGRDIGAGLLVARPIQGLLQKRVLVHSRERPQSRAAEEVTRLILRVIRQEIEAGGWPGAVLPGART
jgi:LysR family transcriptional regulator, nitrogen assimilation regulatory protein